MTQIKKNHELKVGTVLLEGFNRGEVIALHEVFSAASSVAQNLSFKFDYYTIGENSSVGSNGLNLKTGTFSPTKALPDLLFVVGGAYWRKLENDASSFLIGADLRKRTVFLSDAALNLAMNSRSINRIFSLRWQDAQLVLNSRPATRLSDCMSSTTRRVTTSIGGVATYDQALSLVSEYCGLATETQVSTLLGLEPAKDLECTRQYLPADYYYRFDPLIGRAVEYIFKNSSDEIRASDISFAVGVSQRQLERLFRKHLKTSPNAFLRNHRLHEARRQIQLSPASLSEIAVSVGFGSSATMSKHFREKWGVSAAVLRKSQYYDHAS